MALLYQLCFERQTVATAGLVLGRASESLNEMFKNKRLLAKASQPSWVNPGRAPQAREPGIPSGAVSLDF